MEVYVVLEAKFTGASFKESEKCGIKRVPVSGPSDCVQKQPE